MKYSKIILPRLVRAREAKNITRKELAHGLMWSSSKLGRIERGDVELTLDDAIDICIALDISIVDVLYGNDPGVINISSHWPRNQKLIHQMLAMLRMFEEHVEAQWGAYCDNVLDPYYEQPASKRKKRPKPPWKVKDL